MRKTKKRTEWEQREHALMVLWCLSERNRADDNYAKTLRNYCLCRASWEDVQAARAEAHAHGISDDRLIEIDIEVQNSITDEELYEAVYGE